MRFIRCRCERVSMVKLKCCNAWKASYRFRTASITLSFSRKGDLSSEPHIRIVIIRGDISFPRNIWSTLIFVRIHSCVYFSCTGTPSRMSNAVSTRSHYKTYNQIANHLLTPLLLACMNSMQRNLYVEIFSSTTCLSDNVIWIVVGL